MPYQIMLVTTLLCHMIQSAAELHSCRPQDAGGSQWKLNWVTSVSSISLQSGLVGQEYNLSVTIRIMTWFSCTVRNSYIFVSVMNTTVNAQ